MRKILLIIALSLSFCVFYFYQSFAQGYDEGYRKPDDSNQGYDDKAWRDSLKEKTLEGITFMVPDDRPVIKKDGIIMALPIEEYFAMKFDKMNIRLKAIDDSIDENKNDLEFAKNEIEVLKEQIKGLEIIKKEIDSLKDSLKEKANLNQAAAVAAKK